MAYTTENGSWRTRRIRGTGSNMRFGNPKELLTSRGVKSGSVENICEVLGDWTLEQSSAESVSSRVNKGGL
jgi:hypothetical protein